MTFPDDILPKQPILHDGLDSITTADLQSVEVNLSGLQTTIGIRPAGQSLTMAELLRDNCRVATGKMSGSYFVTGSHTVTINGHTWTYEEDSGDPADGFWRNYREYFIDDKSSSLFTTKPIVYFFCNSPHVATTAYNYVASMISGYVTQSFFNPAVASIKYPWGTYTDTYYDIDWLAIEPVNGVIDITEYTNTGEDTGLLL
jgi:hypothetical protein